MQPIKDTTNTLEDVMDVDPLENRSGPSNPFPLTRVWADRGNRCGREDEDLVPEPGSPELSEGGEEAEDKGGGNADGEPEFLTDDEVTPNGRGSPVHVEISARDRLTADFQLHAARAGIFSNLSSMSQRLSDCLSSTGEFGPRRPQRYLCVQLSYHKVNNEGRIRERTARLPHAGGKCAFTV